MIPSFFGLFIYLAVILFWFLFPLPYLPLVGSLVGSFFYVTGLFLRFVGYLVGSVTLRVPTFIAVPDVPSRFGLICYLLLFTLLVPVPHGSRFGYLFGLITTPLLQLFGYLPLFTFPLRCYLRYLRYFIITLFLLLFIWFGWFRFVGLCLFIFIYLVLLFLVLVYCFGLFLFVYLLRVPFLFLRLVLFICVGLVRVPVGREKPNSPLLSSLPLFSLSLCPLSSRRGDAWRSFAQSGQRINITALGVSGELRRAGVAWHVDDINNETTA